MKYIDLHTHQLNNEGEDIQILNVFAQDLPETEPEYFFSAGLHPWHIDQVNAADCFQAIERVSVNKNMLAVGECGLDRSKPTDFALQEYCFRKQIKLAEEHSKPLIIHCVRAYSDLLKIKKETKSDLPWIIHSYRGNPETTRKLIRHGFCFSAGEILLKDISLQNVFRMIPTERIFLETDDREISIRKIYLFAAQILKIDEELLIETICNNFKTHFGNDKLVTSD